MSYTHTPEPTLTKDEREEQAEKMFAYIAGLESNGSLKTYPDVPEYPVIETIKKALLRTAITEPTVFSGIIFMTRTEDPSYVLSVAADRAMPPGGNLEPRIALTLVDGFYNFDSDRICGLLESLSADDKALMKQIVLASLRLAGLEYDSFVKYSQAPDQDKEDEGHRLTSARNKTLSNLEAYKRRRAQMVARVPTRLHRLLGLNPRVGTRTISDVLKILTEG